MNLKDWGANQFATLLAGRAIRRQPICLVDSSITSLIAVYVLYNVVTYFYGFTIKVYKKEDLKKLSKNNREEQ
jgi:hypothetical protein